MRFWLVDSIPWRKQAREAGQPGRGDRQPPGECPRCEEQGKQLERLKARLAEVEAELERARRSGKRQAAPFSKGEPKAKPTRPGRRAGEAYGTKAQRVAPEQVDREVEVRLPDACPDCGGLLAEIGTAEQYQEELPEVRPVVTRFRVQIGRCQQCGRRMQPRHAEQTSAALGAARSQLGPRLVALAAQLNKGAGLSLGKTAAVLQQVSGVRVTRGGARAGPLRAQE